MNIYFLIAGVLCILLGIVHSILGKYLIFRSKRKRGSLVPIEVSGTLKEGHLRIIWATWHLASIFGWCIAAFLIKISLDQHILDSTFICFMIYSTVLAMFASSLLVLLGTKGKHPGWIVLILIGILLVIGSIN